MAVHEYECDVGDVADDAEEDVLTLEGIDDASTGWHDWEGKGVLGAGNVGERRANIGSDVFFRFGSPTAPPRSHGVIFCLVRHLLHSLTHSPLFSLI